jgi:hypothetical protein
MSLVLHFLHLYSRRMASAMTAVPNAALRPIPAFAQGLNGEGDEEDVGPGTAAEEQGEAVGAGGVVVIAVGAKGSLSLVASAEA